MNIPELLKGTIAVPFLELFNQEFKYLLKTNKNYSEFGFILEFKKYADFYSQPFRVDMLVNEEKYPYQCKECGWKFIENSVYPTCSECGAESPNIINNPDWLQSEEKIIFEGWTLPEDEEYTYQYQGIEFDKAFILRFVDKPLDFFISFMKYRYEYEIGLNFKKISL